MSLEKTVEKTKELGNMAGETTKAIDSMSSAIERMTHLGTASYSSVGGMTTAFKDLQEISVKMSESLAYVGTSISKFFDSALPMDGKFETLGKGITLIGTGIGELITRTGDGLVTAFNVFDEPSKDIRSMSNAVFELNKRFGGTIDKAFDFAMALNRETTSEFARGLNLTKKEMMDFAVATERTNITLEQQSTIVDTGIGNASLLAAATALAAANGLELTSVVGLLDTALNKQGKSAQDAIEMIGMFSGVSADTGLNVDIVSRTLNDAASNFTKLGISADFGVPILQGFARVMSDMGLGIENATGLTGELSGALMKVATDYTTAYLMFQRGGLEIGGGGGGVLGASIGLQASVLEAQKSGDSSDLGSKLAESMKATLESFTGGDIVTVQEAAENPELQKQFFTQQQLLKTQFGLSQDAATRTLDYLSGLGDATREGDLETKKALEEQLSREVEGRDKTLDEFEKANRHLAAQSNLLAAIAAPVLLKQRGGAEYLKEVINDLTDKAAKTVQGKVDSYDKGLSSILNIMGAGNMAKDLIDSIDKDHKPPRDVANRGIKQSDLAAAMLKEAGNKDLKDKEEFATMLSAAMADSMKNISKDILVTVRLSGKGSDMFDVSTSIGKQITGE